MLEKEYTYLRDWEELFIHALRPNRRIYIIVHEAAATTDPTSGHTTSSAKYQPKMTIY